VGEHSARYSEHLVRAHHVKRLVAGDEGDEDVVHVLKMPKPE